MKGIENDLDNFLSHVFKQDETSAVLKSHLFLEQTLERSIARWARHPEAILKKSFRDKVDFLYSIGIITKDFQNKLLVVNRIRNKFSHRFGYELSDEDLTLLSELSGSTINIPEDLLTFPKAKEALLFAANIALLIQPLELLDEMPDEKTREILQRAIDKVFKNED